MTLQVACDTSVLYVFTQENRTAIFHGESLSTPSQSQACMLEYALACGERRGYGDSKGSAATEEGRGEERNREENNFDDMGI